MIYITITYNERDTLSLSSEFKILQLHFTEIPTKRCLSIVQGLVSRSFEFINEIETNMIQSLFRSKCYFISHCI